MSVPLRDGMAASAQRSDMAIPSRPPRLEREGVRGRPLDTPKQIGYAIRRENDRGEVVRMKVFYEFLRYCTVGGIAFLADFGALVLAQELFLKEFAIGVYVATALGFVVGLSVNYTLSLWFVFVQEEYGRKGRNVGTFIVFGVIGLVGLLWTELGMWIGVECLEWNYMIVKVLVTGAVLGWNYLVRKILIFNTRGSESG